MTPASLERIIESAVPSVAPAIALSVWQKGEPIIDINAGWLDPDQPERALRADARFDLASLTKLFTATAFLSFVQAGVIGLDDPADSLIPEFSAGGLRSVDGGQEPLSRTLLPGSMMMQMPSLTW